MKPEVGRPVHLRVTKRRVPVTIRLVSQERLAGHLYTDVERVDGSPATLLDRLSEVLEPYLPLAAGGRHILLSKSKVVTIELPKDEVMPPRSEHARSFSVELSLCVGPRVTGEVHAIMPWAHSRTLDYLTRHHEAFIAVFCEERVTLVNAVHIVSVTERHQQDWTDGDEAGGATE